MLKSRLVAQPLRLGVTLGTSCSPTAMQPSKDEFFNYLVIRHHDVQWGLYVTGAGCCSISPKSEYPPNRHPDPYQFTWQKGRVLPEYQVVFIRRGEGVFESGPTGIRRIRGGNVFLTFPGVWHRYHPSKETGWDEYWFGMNGEYLHRLVGQGILAPKNAIWEIDDSTEIEKEYEALIDRVRIQPWRGHSIAAAALQILATAIEAAVTRPPAPTPAFTSRAAEDDLVVRAIQYIWNHSEQPINVADVVSQLPITRRSLERRFHNVLGRTILEEITNCRLQRAKQLLAATHLPVSQIAVLSGFSRTQHMDEAFQRQEGVSPWSYRRGCRQHES